MANKVSEEKKEFARVLYMSGYTDDILNDNDALGPDRQLVRKPFTGELLLRKVREVLDLPVPDATASNS